MSIDNALDVQYNPRVIKKFEMVCIILVREGFFDVKKE